MGRNVKTHALGWSIIGLICWYSNIKNKRLWQKWVV